MEDNTIITVEVIDNMPNKENMFSKENDKYFTKLYDEFIEVFVNAFNEEEEK